MKTNITVTSRNVKEGYAHPNLSPVALALCECLKIDGAQVKHDNITLYRAGKKDMVISTPETVQSFEYLFDMYGRKGIGPFNFAVNVPKTMVLKYSEVV